MCNTMIIIIISDVIYSADVYDKATFESSLRSCE